MTVASIFLNLSKGDQEAQGSALEHGKYKVTSVGLGKRKLRCLLDLFKSRWSFFFFMSWFNQLKTPKIRSHSVQRDSVVPHGVMKKCPQCLRILPTRILKRNNQVCSHCSYHFRLTARERIQMLTDPESFQEYPQGHWKSSDPLKFEDKKGYTDRLQEAFQKTKLTDAFIAGQATLYGLPFHCGVFEFQFMGGSMGGVVGEKISQIFENALKDHSPVLIVSASGGARMQEGIFSLMQMAKVISSLSQFKESGLPYLSLLTDPTTGGVAASFAMLGDLILAEPGALIGFAGPRVIEQTIRQVLPKGFQRSEFLLKHGFIDRVIHRNHLADEIYQWMKRLSHFQNQALMQIDSLNE